MGQKLFEIYEAYFQMKAITNVYQSKIDSVNIKSSPNARYNIINYWFVTLLSDKAIKCARNG